jgi:hypothetical protein
MRIKKLITYTIIVALFFTSGPPDLNHFNRHQNFSTFLSPLIVGATAQAQVDTFTSAAKESNSNFVTYYLPMLVMLGLGVMTIYMMSSMERKTADFYVFAVGALVYLLSVLTSWTSEKKKFEQLPDTINTNTQLSSLQIQKQSFVDLKEIVERRIMFLGAATASFAGAAVMAGIAYTKERTLGTQSERAFQALVAEVQSKCMQIPLVTAQPPFLDARTMQPLSVTCQRNAQELAQCVGRMQAGQSQLNLMAQQPAFPEGSQAASQRSIQTQNTIIERITECLGPALSETRRHETAMSPQVILDPEEVKNRLPYSFELDINGEKHVYLPSAPSERYYDPKASYMEKYFSDDELAEFTLEEIQYLNTWRPDMRLIDGLIGSAHAQVSRELSRIITTGDSVTTNTAGNFTRDALREAGSDTLNNENLSEEYKARHLLIIDSTAVVANIGLVTAAESGATAAVTRATSSAAYRQATSAGTRLVATRAATVLVTTAAVGAGIVTAPVVGAAITATTVVLAAAELYNISDTYLRSTTGRGINDRARDGWNSLRSWWNSYAPPVPKRRRLLVDLIIPQAHAVLPSLSPAASTVLQNTAESSAREVDRWIFNPKGRMILYGAVAVLTGLITKNAHDLKKKVEQDIEGIESIIQNMPSESVQQSHMNTMLNDNLSPMQPYLQSLLSKVFGTFIQNAFADEIAGMLPLAIPCLSPIRGRCVSGNDFIKATLIPGVKYPPFVVEVVKSSAQIGNSLQNKKTVTADVEKHVKRLADLQPVLAVAHDTAKVSINEIERNKYKAEDIPFSKHEAHLSDLFLSIARKEISKAGEPIDFRRIFGPTTQPSQPSQTDSSPIRETEEEHSAVAIPVEPEIEDVSAALVGRNIGQNSDFQDETYGLTDEGINKNSRSDLFELISFRYMIWNARREADDILE